MPSHRFFCPELAAGVNALQDEEAHHAAVVMRCKPGDALELFDGKGHVSEGAVDSVTRHVVRVAVERVRYVPFDLPIELTLAVAMSKAHRQGYLVEKCTELGVAAIWPIISERSVTRPGDAAVEKWSRRGVEAAKQSGRAWTPVISSVTSFADAVQRTSEFSNALMCDTGPGTIPIGLALDQRKLGSIPGKVPRHTLVAFVGPEGGWSDHERMLAQTAGLTRVCLSPTILRAETAAVAVCAVVAAMCARDGQVHS